ncbi:MAG: NAD-dependent epimerase/dehydratase family protein [Planctomycetota bacterium]
MGAETAAAHSKRKVLLTGGGGRIGKSIVEPLKQAFDLRLFDRQPVFGDPATFIGTLQDRGALEGAMAGCEAVIHLAATSDEAPFVEELVPNNVVGLYNALEAALAAKVKRFIFASSCQAVCGHPVTASITGEMAPAPVSLYGATKALGEAMGSWYHRKYGMEFVALRIGWFQNAADAAKNLTPQPPEGWGWRLCITPRDMIQLLRRSVEAEGVGFCIAGGTSKVRHEWLNLDSARKVLGYEPQDDLAALFGGSR